MNIIKKNLPCLDKFKNKEDFVTKLIQNISIICQDNKSFTIQNKIKRLNDTLKELQEKDNKLNLLLEKSSIIKNDFQSHSNELEESNINSKRKLLEFLGSEL